MTDRDEQKLIEKIAQPILDTLLDLQDSINDPCSIQPMTLSLSCMDEEESTLDPELFGMDDEFLDKLQSYLQKELDAWNRPSLLH